MLRGTLAVAIGFLLWTTLWVGATRLVGALVPQYFVAGRLSEADGILLLLLGLSILASVISGYATARIAGFEEIGHTTSLGATLLVVGIYLQSTLWPDLPSWYHVSFAALLVPGALLGGRIRADRRCRED